MRKRGRVDKNQEEIVRVLRLYPGISVVVTSSIGNGFGDLAVGFKGRTFIFEVKNPTQPPSKRKLTKVERNFAENWAGQYQVVETVTEILNAIGFGRKG